MCTLPCHAYLNRTCIILGCASCHVYTCVFTMLFVSFRLCSFSLVPVFVAIMRIRLSTLGSSLWLHLLHGLILLPCGISGKMTISSKSLLSLLASCSLYCYAYAAIPTTCFIMPPILPCQTTNPPCPSKPLFGYVTALLSPSYSIVSCR